MSRKMASVIGDPIQYALRLGEEQVPLNPHIGNPIKLSFNGQINCIICGRKTKKSFAQGSCYPCMRNAPENSECVVRPELCRAHLGEGRDPEWEQRNHAQEHVVYLAVSSEFKVGVTRATQVPTRWIDQGASQVRVLARTPHRCAAGELEVALKEAFTDRTHWQKMLKNEVLENPHWGYAMDQAFSAVPWSHEDFIVDDEEVVVLQYPVQQYPEKIKSLSFDKVDTVEGTLLGIKGQYLLFDDNRVLNIRKHNGYHLRFEA